MSTHPRAVHIYLQHMLKHVAKHCLQAKLSLLLTHSRAGLWTEDDISQWESIDQLLQQGQTAAERKCLAKRSGQHAWSPDLAKTGNLVLYWRLRLCEYTSCQVNLDKLDSLATELHVLPIETDWLSFLDIRQHLWNARHAHRQAKIMASKLFEDHLEEMAKLAGALHGTSDTVARAAICSREKASRQFLQLRSILNPSASSGLDRIDVPNAYAILRIGEEVPRIPLVVKEEIEEVLLPHTEQRFRQHQETPFGHGHRQQSLGIDCTSDDAAALMKGTYDRELDQLTEEARVWLQELKSNDFVRAGCVISTCLLYTSPSPRD